MHSSRAEWAPCGGLLHQQAVVRSTQEFVFPQGELVPRQEVSAAHRAAKTLHVIDIVPSAHHQVAAAEAHVAFRTLDAKYPKRGARRVEEFNATSDECVFSSEKCAARGLDSTSAISRTEVHL